MGACSVWKVSVFESFARIRVEGKCNLNALRVDADFFKYGGKNFRFQKYSDTGDGGG